MFRISIIESVYLRYKHDVFLWIAIEMFDVYVYF